MIVADVQVNQPTTSIPFDFVGTSFEINGDADKFPNLVLEQLLRNTHGPIRVGGGSSFFSCTVDDYIAPPCGILQSDSLVEKVRDAAKRIGAKLIWNLNWKRPDSLISQAQHLAGLGVKNLEPVNEPDLFGNNPLPTFEGEWPGQIAALRASIPGVTIYGPSVCCAWTVNVGTTKGNWLINFANNNDADVITAHPYLTSYCDKSNPPSMEYTLDEKRMQSLRNRYSLIPANIRQSLIFGESNTCACGGVLGVSDTMGAALTTADFGFEAMKMGVKGLWFHNAGENYNAISIIGNTGAIAKAPYYGLYMLSQAAGQQFIPVNVAKGAENVKVYASSRSDGQTRVYILNKELTAEVDVDINVPGKTGIARGYTMGGAALTSTTDIKFGVKGVGADGKLSLVNDLTIAPVNGTYKVHLRNGVAVMLIL